MCLCTAVIRLRTDNWHRSEGESREEGKNYAHTAKRFLSISKNKKCTVTETNLRLTLCTTSCNIQKFCFLPTMHLCLLRTSPNKRRFFFLYTALTYRLLKPNQSVYCMVGSGSLNQTDIVSYLQS